MTEQHEKLKKVVNEIAAFCKTPKKIGLAGIFAINELAKDYGQILVQDTGALKNVGLNQAGPTTYLWVGGEVTDELISKMINIYNQKRNFAAQKNRINTKSEILELKSVIEKLTETVFDLVEIIKENKLQVV